MDKITDFTKINKYFCTLCKGFHNRYGRKRDEKGNKVMVVNFVRHQEYGYLLSESENWNRLFKKSWNKYDLQKAIENHKPKR